MNLRWLAPFLAFLPALLTGCEQAEPFLPKVRFDRFEVNDIDFEHVEADFVFSVDNPNPVEIELARFGYELGFEQTLLLDGEDEDGLLLEAIGSSELALPVDMAWEDAWNTVQATRGKDDIGFYLEGDFGFDTPIGLIDIPYREDGAFPAVRRPRFQVTRFRVAQIDAWPPTAHCQLYVDVDNDHESSITPQQFDYAIDLGSGTVASGLIADLGPVEGATTRTITIPIDVDLLEVGDTVYQAITGNGRLDIGIDADMDVDTPFGILPLSIDETGNIQVES